MKRFFSLLAVSVSVFAGGLDQKLVPANAKWVLHLDGDAFRKTKIGAAVIEEKCEPQVRKAEQEAKTKFDFSFNKISSLTAFGTLVGEEKDSVLIVNTTADVRSDLQKLIALKELQGGANPPIVKLNVNGADIYQIHSELNLMPVQPNLWLLGKSKTALEAARQVALGNAPALAETDFIKRAQASDSFLFAAADMTSGAKLPAQARLLQKADSGQIELGEKDERVQLLFTLRSKDTDTITHMAEVLQGLKALAALSMSEDKDLSSLLNSASFASTENSVSVRLRFPVGRAIQKVRESDK